MTAEMFVGLLVEGAILAVPLIVVTFLLSRFTRDIFGPSLLALFLFAAAGAYFGFALLAAPSPVWTLGELAQVLVFGAMGLLGLRGSAWWLAGGWDIASTMGRRGSLLGTGALVRSHDLYDSVPQL